MSTESNEAPVTHAEQPANAEPQTAQEALAQILAAQEAAEAAASAPAEPEKAPEPPKAEEDKFASKFAALSRKEKEVRQREHRLQNELRQFEARVRQMEDKMKFSEGYEKELDEDPIGFLAKRGKSYKDITEKYVLKGDPTPEDKTNQAIKELSDRYAKMEAELAKRDSDLKTEREEVSKVRQQEAQQTFMRDITTFVNDGGERFDLIQKNDAVQLVYDVIEEHYNQIIQETGSDSDIIINELIEKAADEVENYLLEEAKKLVTSNKLKSLLSTSQTPTPKPKTNPVTLSNSASQVAPTPTDSDYLSHDESKKQMAASLKWVD